MRRIELPSPLLLLGLLAAALLGACDGEEQARPANGAATAERPATPAPDAEALRGRVAELTSRVGQQQAPADAAENAVADAEAALAKARSEAERARGALAETEASLEEARAKLAVAAPPPPRRTDAELFRLVQLELLEAEALSQVAISVDVEDGVVRLRGRVPDDETAQAALTVARAAAAPAPVRDEIDRAH